MTDTPAPPARYANGRFGPGNPGRRAGSRNRSSHKVLMSILEDFEKHKEELFHRLRVGHAPSYFNTLARIVPPMLEAGAPDVEVYTDAEAAALVARARQVLAVHENPRRALMDLDLLLTTEPASPGADR